MDIAALQKEIADLKTATAEQKRNAEYWFNKASEKPAPATPATPAADPEPEIDVLELATKGGRAFEKYLQGWAQKNGYVRGSEMTEAITQKAQELAKQS